MYRESCCFCINFIFVSYLYLGIRSYIPISCIIIFIGKRWLCIKDTEKSKNKKIIFKQNKDINPRNPRINLTIYVRCMYIYIYRFITSFICIWRTFIFDYRLKLKIIILIKSFNSPLESKKESKNRL